MFLFIISINVSYICYNRIKTRGQIMDKLPIEYREFWQRWNDFEGKSSVREYWLTWAINFGISFGSF